MQQVWKAYEWLPATGWRGKKQGIDTARVESLESLANIVPFLAVCILKHR